MRVSRMRWGNSDTKTTKIDMSMPGLAKAAESGLIERSWLASPHEIGLEHTTSFV